MRDRNEKIVDNGFTMRRRVLAALAATALAMARAHAAPPDRPPLRIGLSLGLTGVYAADSEMMGKAYRLWEQEVNTRGGILGRRVEVLIRDDRSDIDTARAIYEDYTQRGQSDLVMGPFSSAITAAVAPIIDRHGYPMLAPGGAAETMWQKGYRNLFGIIPPAGRHAIGFLALIADAGIDALAIVHADDPFSTVLAEETRKWLPEYGIRLTSFEKVAKGHPDLDAAAQAARRSGARALLMAGHFDESVNMRRALSRIGWTPAAYYASVGPGLDKYGSVLGAAAEGSFATTTWEPHEKLQLPDADDFRRAFLRRWGELPNFLAAHAYSACQVLERALILAGGFDRDKLRDTLYRLDMNVLIGRYAVDRTGLQTKRFPLVVQWQRGRREIVWPPELATAPARLGR